VHGIPNYHVSHPSNVNTPQLLDCAVVSNHFILRYSSFLVYFPTLLILSSNLFGCLVRCIFSVVNFLRPPPDTASGFG
jgi:hypothetical protein